jgi:uncharacterized membrane protein YozB (DUF420 family)
MDLLLVSIYFSKRRVSIHCNGVILAIAIHLISVFTVMVPSMTKGIVYAPVHITLGFITEFLALFTVLHMKGKIPKRFMVRDSKNLMRAAGAIWVITYVSGVYIYWNIT